MKELKLTKVNVKGIDYWQIAFKDMQTLGVFDGKKYQTNLSGFPKEALNFDNADELIIDLDKCEYEVQQEKNKVKIKLIDKNVKLEEYENDTPIPQPYLWLTPVIETKRDNDGNYIKSKHWYVYKMPDDQKMLENLLLTHLELDMHELLNNSKYAQILKNSDDLGMLGNKLLQSQDRFEVRYAGLKAFEHKKADSLIIYDCHKFKFIVGYDNKIWIEII